MYFPYVNCTPLVDWQLDTATNHQRSLAVLKFRVPRHCILAIPEMVSLILWHPETTTFSVKLINWLLAIWKRSSKGQIPQGYFLLFVRTHFVTFIPNLRTFNTDSFSLQVVKSAESP